jgi:catechol 2,3-dioxygenase-like lactoylglutathione lyase family enzyme
LSKADVLLRVADLHRSVEFYKKVGCSVVYFEGETGVAQVRFPDGHGILLVPLTHPAVDVGVFLKAAFDEPAPGKRVYFQGSNLKRLAEDCASHRIADVSFEQEEYWHTLVISDPDGYLLSFHEELDVSDEQIISGYQRGPILLQEALTGLEERQFDLRRAPGKWSIRETVLHLVDSDVTTAITMKFALAEPGRIFTRSPYNPDQWAVGAAYARRPIHVEVQLFSLIRQHILGICHVLPDALDRTVVRENGEVVSVRFLMKLLAGHAMGHINQVWETRRVHNL